MANQKSTNQLTRAERVVERPKMSIENRAKIFIPFDALKGFREALERKEKEIFWQKKQEQTPDQIEHIDQQLSQMKIGDRIQLSYIEEGVFNVLDGELQEVSYGASEMRIEDVYIRFDSICDLEIL